jgi:LPXTG-site transpeptidase (sortase) family protein
MTTLRILLTAAFVLLVAGCGGSVAPVPPKADGTPPPVSINIPAIKARSSLELVGVDEQQRIEVPSVHKPEQAGYYAYSPKPGDPGPAVILGHVNGDGRPGVFAKLSELKRGDLVIIDRADGSKLAYAVTLVRVADKDEFPTQEVYGPTPGSELRLITCGGAWEGGQTGYADNIIVHAKILS